MGPNLLIPDPSLPILASLSFSSLPSAPSWNHLGRLFNYLVASTFLGSMPLRDFKDITCSSTWSWGLQHRGPPARTGSLVSLGWCQVASSARVSLGRSRPAHTWGIPWKLWAQDAGCSEMLMADREARQALCYFWNEVCWDTVVPSVSPWHGCLRYFESHVLRNMTVRGRHAYLGPDGASRTHIYLWALSP